MPFTNIPPVIPPELLQEAFGVSRIEDLSDEEIIKRGQEYQAKRRAQWAILLVYSNLIARVRASSLEAYRQQKGQ